MTGNEQDERLACGVEIATLVDQVADGTPPADPEHQVTCPHCGPALSEIEELWGRVRELAREEVVTPEQLARSIIRRIRQDVTARRLEVPLEAVVPRLLRHALFHSERGTTRIADAVVAEIVSGVVREVPGVHSLGGGLAGALQAGIPVGATTEGVEVEVSGERVAVHVRLVVRHGASIARVANAVRASVIRNVAAVTGLEVAEVNITVEDVHVGGG